MIRMETKRLTIRDHVEQDAESLHRLLSNEKAMFFIQDLKTNTLDESKLNLYEAIKEAHLEKRTKFFFAIVDKKTNEYIGEIGYTVIIESSEGNVVNLGYFTLPEFWGRGIVTEAAEVVIEFAFTQGNVIKIETGCIKDNFASEGVMKKLGLIKEAELIKHVLLESRLLDRIEYRILKEEWQVKSKNSK